VPPRALPTAVELSSADTKDARLVFEKLDTTASGTIARSALVAAIAEAAKTSLGTARRVTHGGSATTATTADDRPVVDLGEFVRLVGTVKAINENKEEREAVRLVAPLLKLRC
jgi:Ca2+-binding EF-hand superfamily protein